MIRPSCSSHLMLLEVFFAPPCLAPAASATAAAVAAPAAARTLTAAAWGQAACVKAIAFSLCLGL